jgi:hypothetical protein
VEEPIETDVKEKHEQYEQSVRIITAFFAAVVGFGLKHILDGGGPASISNHKWAFFIVTTLLFLRYLLGSANHLWVEHVKSAPTPRTKLLIWKDVGFLLIFGYLAATMCFAVSSSQFYLSGIYLILASITWSIIEAPRWLIRWRCNRDSVGMWWIAWLLLNVLHLGAFYAARRLDRCEVAGPDFTTWSWPMVLLVPATVVIFAIDYFFQLWQVEKASNP